MVDVETPSRSFRERNFKALQRVKRAVIVIGIAVIAYLFTRLGTYLMEIEAYKNPNVDRGYTQEYMPTFFHLSNHFAAWSIGFLVGILLAVLAVFIGAMLYFLGRWIWRGGDD